MFGNRTRLTALALVVLVTTALAGPAAMTVSADEDTSENGVVSPLFHDEDTDWSRAVDTILAFVNGKATKYNPLADRPDKSNAAQYRDTVKKTFNENNEPLQNWTNDRVNAAEDGDVARIKFTDKSGNSEWLFVVADVNESTGEYENARALNLTEFKKTDREVDLNYRLSPYASRNLDGELETFVDEFAEPNEDLTRDYVSGWAGEYGGEVEGDYIPEDL
jgi:hypothetical protein